MTSFLFLYLTTPTELTLHFERHYALLVSYVKPKVKLFAFLFGLLMITNELPVTY